MCDAILHRGPDSDGYLVRDGIAMGMRRLSVIDVGGGDQPISNEDNSVTVVFNGEIYNHHELRRELRAAGHRFTTRTDTEVLVHLYEEHGTAMASRLKGMFAFSIWDEKRKQLFVARDRTGIKPLAYSVRHGGIVFGSELRCLYAFDKAAINVSPGAIMEYLAYGYIPDPGSIFSDVKKLSPGHCLLWRPAREIQVWPYWEAPIPDRTVVQNEDEAVEQLRHLLDEAVRSHLEAEVPLGAFLSGGLDSSTVVALMCRHASGRVKTFSIGFAEKDYDESSAAKAVANHFNTDHVALVVRPDVEEIFESVALMFDEPFADSSAIPTFLVSQLARQRVTVALSGDGGDELFGGYTRYSETLRRTKPGRSAIMWLLSAMALMLPHAVPGRNRLIDKGRSRIGRYAATVLQPVRTDEGGIASKVHPLAQTRLDKLLREHFTSDLADDFAAAMMRVDLKTYLPGDILTKVDRTSMAVSLEARVPLLDCDLMDFALRIPGDLRVTSAETKKLFRRAIRGIVPNFVLTRPKQGFQIPLARWFQGPLHHRIAALRSPSVGIDSYVDRKAVARLVAEHSVGRRDHSAVLWRLMVLDRWLAAYREGKLAQSPAVPNSGWSLAGGNLAATVSSAKRPAAVSGLFLKSGASKSPLRVALLVDGNVPAYVRGIIRDLLRADFIELVLVATLRRAGEAAIPTVSVGPVFRAYEAYIEPRHPFDPDPLEQVECGDLIAQVPELWLEASDSGSVRTIEKGGVDRLSAANLDVLLDFGLVPPRGDSLPEARYGVWRYHFGDRERYPDGSGFFREIVDGCPVSGIELTRLGRSQDQDITIQNAYFSTVPFPSRRANRFGPIWGSRHFVVQSLWEIHQGASVLQAPAKQASQKLGTRGPGDPRIFRWLIGRAARRMHRQRAHTNGPVAWRIAVRRTKVPLFEDASISSLSTFKWLECEPGRLRADPVIFLHDGEYWLFFEELAAPGSVGCISCGRLLEDGTLVDERVVLRRPYHVSFPQIVQSDGEIFMMPEAAQAGGIDLYRMRRFPNEWNLEARLVNVRCVDSTVFQTAEGWWMITSPQVAPGHAPISWLLRSDRLTGPWRFPRGGTVANHAGVARGGGAVFNWNGRLIRPSQDCSTAYGRALLFNEIVSLEESRYQERTICRVDASWKSKLAAVHSYSLSADWEAIDGGFEIA